MRLGFPAAGWPARCRSAFVAEDSFLPRWLSKRGHRLVFSNGIIVFTVLALALLLAVGANTNNLVPGTVGITSTGAVMVNPAYELLD